MNNVFLSMGSNMGDKNENLSKAVIMIQNLENTFITLESSIYRTSPLYNSDQSYFLNKVVQIKTKLNPYKLFKKMKSIEKMMGRCIENSHNFPRIIDIDILTYGDLNISTYNLTIPHPKICERRFVLEPWCEIAPNHTIVNQQLSIQELLNNDHDLMNQSIEIVKN